MAKVSKFDVKGFLFTDNVNLNNSGEISPAFLVCTFVKAYKTLEKELHWHAMIRQLSKQLERMNFSGTHTHWQKHYVVPKE